MGEGLLLKYQLFQMSVEFKNARFLFERIPGQPLFYVSEDFIQGELFKNYRYTVVQRLDAG